MCSCGCNSCETKPAVILNENLVKKEILSEGLKYHLDNNKPLTEHLYRAGSKEYFNLFAEARALYARNILEFSGEDLNILVETDLGHHGLYEGKKVPLDFPIEVNEAKKDTYDKFLDDPQNPKGRAKTIITQFLKKYGEDASQMAVDRFAKQNNLKPEEKYILKYITKNDISITSQPGGPNLSALNEQGADTAWEDNEGNKVTLQDILDMTKDVPQKDYPTEKLAKVVLNWDDNPEEVERVGQVEISKQYPILIMVNEAGKIQWILDGNHRAQKALRANAETIPAKLIKPSMLDAKAKKVLLGIVSELKEGKRRTLDFPVAEAVHRGKKVKLNKPKRGGNKKFYVYVRDPKTKNIKKVSFGGTTGLKAKINDPAARRSFAKRHRCAQKNDKTKPGYWSCRLPRYSKLLGLEGSYTGFW